MKITFNDGQELQIQQVTEQTDGALLIKTISASEDQLKTLFSDPTTTKRMSVSERDADTVVYENYTKLDAIVKYTAGILGVLMYREGYRGCRQRCSYDRFPHTISSISC